VKQLGRWRGQEVKVDRKGRGERGHIFDYQRTKKC